MQNKQMGIIVLTLGLLLVFGGTRVVQSMGMGFVIFLTFMLLYSQMPMWVRKMLAHIHWVVDVSMTYLAYVLIPGNTATALFASAIIGLLVTLFMLSECKRLLGEQKDLAHIVQRLNHVDAKAAEKLRKAQMEERNEYV